VQEAGRLEKFLREVERRLGAPGSIREFGVSRILTVRVRDRPVEVGINRSSLWLRTDLRIPLFPSQSTVCWAPRGSYDRAKYLEGADSERPEETRDPNFDGTYLLVSAEPGALAAAMPAAARKLLWHHRALRPHIRPQEIEYDPQSLQPVGVRDQLHIRAEPDLRTDPTQVAALGTQNLGSTSGASMVKSLAELAGGLEAAWGLPDACIAPEEG
jgi:hypothetical protein